MKAFELLPSTTAGGMAELVKYVSSKLEALSSNQVPPPSKRKFN
jgi:hypothetical protein